MLDLRTNLIKKLFALVMVIMTVCSMAPVALAAGTNPLTFQGAYLTTTNHLTESDPIKQTSTPGVSVLIITTYLPVHKQLIYGLIRILGVFQMDLTLLGQCMLYNP